MRSGPTQLFTVPFTRSGESGQLRRLNRKPERNDNRAMKNLLKTFTERSLAAGLIEETINFRYINYRESTEWRVGNLSETMFQPEPQPGKCDPVVILWSVN
jgi:hypothetical protein